YTNKIIRQSRSCSDILASIIDLCRDSRLKLYVIIDEYDNFANTILSTVGQDAYTNLTRGAGPFRSFFNVLKGGTTGSGAPITRSFITGVSPITMDDVTSGYNIGENISLDTLFNPILGFTRGDVREMLVYYKSAGKIGHEPDDLLQLLNQWYGNYAFSLHFDAGTGERMFNSDMVLYFLKEYFKTGTVPDDLIDRNVRIDYGKLRHLLIIERKNKATTNGNFNRVREIIETGETTAKIQKGFPLEKLVDENNFTSLLYYFGLLTISRDELNDQVLRIPNETIRRLYYDYIREGYEETDVFALNLSTYGRLMKGAALRGEWEPLLGYLTGLMRESMSLRDLITGEKSIQAFLNVYLGLSDLYTVHPEREMNKGYADIVLEPFLARYEGIRYSYILEIKYLKTDKRAIKQSKTKPAVTSKKVNKLREQAESQLRSYALDKRFSRTIGKTRLIKLVLIFSGSDALYMGSVD
ncbi:MAG: AAA family ATPase, partial [bacterium]|nr:AAA family ATPase [bacterium]